MKAEQPQVVVQIVQKLVPGDLENMAIELMRLQPVRTLIISLEGNLDQAIADWPVLKEIESNLIFLNKQPGYQWRLLNKLWRIFKVHQVSAVHTHHIGPLFYGGLVARMAGIVKVVHTEHDAWHLAQFKRRILERILLAIVRPIFIADARQVANQVSYYLQRDHVQVIRHGINLDKFCPGDKSFSRQTLNLPEDITIIGSAGRLERIKGHDVLIASLAQLPDTTHLALAGEGSCELALRKQAKLLNVEHRVHFLGLIEDMPLFYRALDLFCLPSRSEGMPLAPLEAQSCGIPALLTNVGANAEALCYSTGHLVEADSPDKMATAILLLLAQSYHGTPRSFIAQHCDAKVMAAAYNRIVNCIN